MSQRQQVQTVGSVDSALQNLSAIKCGDDPDTQSAQTDVSVQNRSVNELTRHTRDELTRRHDDVVRTREEIRSLFEHVVNVIEPENTWADEEPPYPLDSDQFAYSYVTQSSNTWARCGPRDGSPRFDGAWVFFADDKVRCGKMTKERLLNVLVHEATHITEGSQTSGSAHNPTFWRTLADYAVTFARETDEDFDLDLFVSHCAAEPNRSMTDRRMRTVEEQRDEVWDRIVEQW